MVELLKFLPVQVIFILLHISCVEVIDEFYE